MTNTTQLTFARKCDNCKKLINEGFVFDGGCEYYCSTKCLYKHFTKEEWKKLYDNGNGDSYWTTWEDEHQYNADGTEIEEEEEFKCKNVTAKYTLIRDSIPIYNSFEDVLDDEQEPWIIIDNTLYSRRWEE